MSVSTLLRRTTIKYKGEDLVNIKKIGARGDSNTDDHQVVQEIIDSYPNRSAALFVPPSNGGDHYMMDSALTVGQATKIRGAGSLMQYQVSNSVRMDYKPQSVFDFSRNVSDGIVTPLDASVGYRAHGIKIEGLLLIGSGSGSSGNGKSGILLRDNTLGSAPRTIVGLTRIIDCYLEGWGYAYDWQNSDSCHIIDCAVDYSQYGYRDLTGCQQPQILNTDFWNLSGPAITTVSLDGRITDCEIEPLNSNSGIIATDYRTLKIQGNIFQQCGHAIELIGGKGAVVDGNTFRTLQFDAIRVGKSDGTNGSNHNTIGPNAIESWGGVTTSGGRAAIRVFGPSKFNSIHDNAIHSPQQYGLKGIVTQDGGSNKPFSNMIDGNTVDPAVATPYATSSTAALGSDIFGDNLPRVDTLPSEARGSWTPEDYGMIAWTFDPAVGGAGQATTAGVLNVIRIPVRKARLVTNLHLHLSTAGTSLTSGRNFAALYDSAGTLIDITADQSTNWQSTGQKVMPLTAPKEVAAGYVYLCFWTSSTTPQFIRGTGTLTSDWANLALTDYRFATADTGLTTTAPSTLGTRTRIATAWWAAIS